MGSSVTKPNINLQALVINDVALATIMWQQFYGTFKATIDKKENLSNIQKFTDLQGYLEELPLKCIEGMTL